MVSVRCAVSYRAQGWVLHNPWFYGEHLVYDLADFDVTVTFTDGANPKVAASGAEVDAIYGWHS